MYLLRWNIMKIPLMHLNQMEKQDLPVLILWILTSLKMLILQHATSILCNSVMAYFLSLRMLLPIGKRASVILYL